MMIDDIDAAVAAVNSGMEAEVELSGKEGICSLCARDTCPGVHLLSSASLCEGFLKVNSMVPDVNAVPDPEPCKFDPSSRYYDAGQIEVQDIIRAKLTPEQYEGFCLGNVIKYSCRANWKGQFDRDMEKTGFYAKFLSEFREGRK